MRLIEFNDPSTLQPGDRHEQEFTYGPVSDEQFEKIKNYLQLHCSDFLKTLYSTKRFLYSGIDTDVEWFVGSSRKNRNPTDTPLEIQTAVDNKLSAAGFKALRSNSIYTSISLGTARMYSGSGQIFRIFPMNGFNFTTSDQFSDLTVEFLLSNDGYDKYKNLPNHKKQYNPMHRLITSFNLSPLEFVDQWQFKNSDLAAAILRFRPNEILINGNFVALGGNKFDVFSYADYCIQV